MRGFLIVFGCVVTIVNACGAVPKGTYRLTLSTEAQSLCRMLGVPEQDVRYAFADDGIFTYRSVAAGQLIERNGRVEASGDAFRLAFADLVGSPESLGPSGSFVDGKLTIDGLSYRLEEAIEPAPIVISMVGTWTLLRSSGDDPSIRFIFDKRGTFRFAGSNGTSSGKYVLVGMRLQLVWTEIDGQPVEEGLVKKTVSVARDGSAFMIDTFAYGRKAG